MICTLSSRSSKGLTVDFWWYRRTFSFSFRMPFWKESANTVARWSKEGASDLGKRSRTSWPVKVWMCTAVAEKRNGRFIMAETFNLLSNFNTRKGTHLFQIITHLLDDELFNAIWAECRLWNSSSSYEVCALISDVVEFDCPMIFIKFFVCYQYLLSFYCQIAPTAFLISLSVMVLSLAMYIKTCKNFNVCSNKRINTKTDTQ